MQMMKYSEFTLILLSSMSYTFFQFKLHHLYLSFLCLWFQVQCNQIVITRTPEKILFDLTSGKLQRLSKQDPIQAFFIIKFDEFSLSFSSLLMWYFARQIHRRILTVSFRFYNLFFVCLQRVHESLIFSLKTKKIKWKSVCTYR